MIKGLGFQVSISQSYKVQGEHCQIINGLRAQGNHNPLLDDLGFRVSITQR